LKEEALDRIKWRNRFARGCGHIVWQITDDHDDDVNMLLRDRQCTYNVTVRSVRETIVAVEKQIVLRILSVWL
jgi:hypothetical protein